MHTLIAARYDEIWLLFAIQTVVLHGIGVILLPGSPILQEWWSGPLRIPPVEIDEVERCPTVLTLCLKRVFSDAYIGEVHDTICY